MTDFNEAPFDENYEAPTTILDIDTSDAVEPKCVEDGEYLIRITGFKKDDKGNIVRTKLETGNKFFILSFDIPDEPYSKGFSQIFSVPTPDMEPKRVNAVKWELDCFKRCFGVSEIDFNNLVGKTGYALLIKTTSAEYGDQNKVSKFIVGA